MAFAIEEKKAPLHLKYAQLVTLRYGKLPTQISVRTSTSALAGLTNLYEELQNKGICEPVVPWQVAEALKHLETTLGILVDCRQKRQGATERFFRLELWHPISEIQSNLEEINRKWPKPQSSVPTGPLDQSHSPFSRNQQLLKLINVATQPITWRQFSNAIGLSEANELQSKLLLAETCILLIDNPPSYWIQYLYRFAPLHLLEAGIGAQLLPLLTKIPSLQRSTVDLIVEQMIRIHSWPSGETNSFLLLLAHSEEWGAIKTLIEIVWKLLDSGEEQLANQLVQLLPNDLIYKSQIQKLLEVKKAALYNQNFHTILLAGKMLKVIGLPESLKAKVISLLIKELIIIKRHKLAWKICERALKNTSPESNLEDWLTFQLALCELEFILKKTDCAGARLIGLEKIVLAQNCKFFYPLVLELKGEYCISKNDKVQARANLQESLKHYQISCKFSKVKQLENKLNLL